MVEVFKTNVNDRLEASRITREIQAHFEGYHVNFDLQDCDCILRIATAQHRVDERAIICLLMQFGYWAEVLPDRINPVSIPAIELMPQL